MSLELWQRYRDYIASVGMWDIDSGRTHAVEAGRTLCGCTPIPKPGPKAALGNNSPAQPRPRTWVASVA